ncbi:peptidoglycan DD-metalloendopeptidase family protein [Enterococcus faecium]|uniref:glucosaminidase domain-containing protein n=1 Tax=Enterococcus faecium TaxID=1352 RepID=UPI0023E8C474|nr:glucosaminidase domain-containing protein [Enterococcus faecium]MDF3826033.1 peptidoglycan DD-metalloendopeptidase family protein [Enterococcus faecium]
MKNKRITKLASTILLSQIILTAPLNVLASEKIEYMQDTNMKQEIPISDCDSLENEKETSSSENDTNNADSTVNESGNQTIDSSIENSQTTDSAQETPQPETSESSPQENIKPVETKPSTSKPEEQTTNKPMDSVNQGTVSSTTKPEDVIPETSYRPAILPSDEKEQQPSETPVHLAQEEVKNYHQAPAAPIQDLVPSSQQDTEGNIHFEKNESVESFIRKIGESARKVGQEKDLYASVMIAQAILESANGQSKLAQAPNHNLFGIKGTYKGKGVSFVTQEDLGNGTLHTTEATFRKYDTYEESLKDYAQLLKEGLPHNSHFYEGVWKSQAKTYQEATKFLTGRYATDTTYDKKLNGLIETYDLTSYDKEVAVSQLNKKGYMVPLKKYTISSPFGTRGREFHRGLDFAASQGEPIYASKSGKVIKAEYHPSWGNVVVIEHEDGTSALYAHQQEYEVKVGNKVSQGEIIGYVGSTGHSTGSHLHLEICTDTSLIQSKLINPEKVLF